MESNSWSKRLRLIMEELGISKAELSRKSGINYDSINKYVRGEVENPRGDVFERLAHVLNCKVEWLVFGSDEITSADMADFPRTSNIAFYGDVRAGAWLEVNALHEPSFEDIPVMPDQRFKNVDQFAVRVVGDSMDLVFVPGTFLICVSLQSLGREPKDNEFVIAEKTMNGLKEVTVKKYSTENGHILLKPESSNPSHKSISFRRGGRPQDVILVDQVDVSIIGLVIGEYRKF